MLNKLLNWLGGHGAGAAVDMTQSRLDISSKEERQYRELVGRIMQSEGDTYLLSEDEFSLIKEKSKRLTFQAPSLCSEYSFNEYCKELECLIEISINPYKSNVRLHGKQLIPNWPYKGRKTKRYYY